MATFNIAWNASTRVATAQDAGDALPGGSTLLGTFIHNDPVNDKLDSNETHVLYHHVRDALYGIGVYDMQRVTIATTIAP